RYVQMGRQHQSIPHLPFPPAEDIPLPVNLDICEADSAELGGHILGALPFVECRRGDLGDGHLRSERLLVAGLEMSQSFSDILALQHCVIGVSKQAAKSENSRAHLSDYGRRHWGSQSPSR